MSDINVNDERKSIFKEWLEKLQQESWQLELLISGFAIFGIYSARTIITDIDFYTTNQVFGIFRKTSELIGFIFKAGWLIFFLNLIVHVILRGLWIGTIGLRYVSQEIDYESLGYSDLFTNFLKKKVGSYDDFIERLEKICSVLFAFTFLLFLLFSSLMIFLVQIILIVLFIHKLGSKYEQSIAFSGLFAMVYFFLGLIVFVDLISLGGIKKIRDRHVSKIYFYIYQFFSFTTLSFLYRPLLYNFIDNSYTRKLFYLSIPYIFLIMGGYKMIENNPNPYFPEPDLLLSNGKLIDDYFYDDLRKIHLDEFTNEERKINKKQLKQISLEAFYLRESNSSIFIKLDKNMKTIIENDKTIYPYKKEGFTFSWFNANLLDDKEIEEIKNNRDKEITGLYTQKKEISKKNKKSFSDADQKMRDSLTSIIESKNMYWKSKIAEAESIKINKIINRYVSSVKIYIDSVKINLNQCYFYHHPHYNEQGLKCFFNTDSIKSGVHELKFVKNLINNDEELTQDSLFLPIIKI